jgi:hypothetical protein
VNPSLEDAVLIPWEVVTVTFTLPAAYLGDSAVMDVAEVTVTFGASVAPNITFVTPVKLVPVMITEVPPVVGPVVGLIFVTVGRLEPRAGATNTNAPAIASESAHGATPIGTLTRVRRVVRLILSLRATLRIIPPGCECGSPADVRLSAAVPPRVSMKPYTNHVVASRGIEIQATRRPEQTAVGAAVCSPVSPRHACFGRRMKIKGLRLCFGRTLRRSRPSDRSRTLRAGRQIASCGLRFGSSVGRRARCAGFSPARGRRRRAGAGL